MSVKIQKRYSFRDTKELDTIQVFTMEYNEMEQEDVKEEKEKGKDSARQVFS